MRIVELDLLFEQNPLIRCEVCRNVPPQTVRFLKLGKVCEVTEMIVKQSICVSVGY